ncbi:MAG TPA: AmmeMemoRadiSam system radical SAM enzyme [Anaerolineaceae bacterium]|nr:AmmeMemoRadiSam system radical SAM enzyme [Anaerolineaceae bacterium]
MSKDYEALLYEKLADNKVRCQLCAHHCLIADGKRGICRVRENKAGVLYSLTYGKLIAAHVDPIEKKPMFHFYPGSRSFSIASPGCNFDCQWCQNWEISQGDSAAAAARCPYTPPQDVVSAAKREGCLSISYTYTEPTVFFEFTQDVGILAREAGLKNVYVSNGYMSPQTIALLARWLDAANVDIKAFSDEVYRKHIGARLQPVLDACSLLKQAGVWLEITTLLIPGLNDDEAQIRGLTRYIVRELGAETPWHVSRFFPQYKYQNTDATSVGSIEKAMEIGKAEGLRYVYAGNIAGSADTYCPQCGAVLIKRSGMSTLSSRVSHKGACPVCGARIAGVGLSGEEGSA